MKREKTASEAGLLLAEKGRWLTPQEAKMVYELVYPAGATSKWNAVLSRGNDVPTAVVEEELGAAMVPIYPQLVTRYKLPYAGSRRHANDPALFGHLWNCAVHTTLLGLPLEARLAALMHEVPEHRARGVDEALKIISDIRQDTSLQMPKQLANILNVGTDYESIAVDHAGHCLFRNGSRGNSKTLEALTKSVEQSIDALKARKSESLPFYGAVQSALNDFKNTINSEGKRVVPPSLIGLPYGQIKEDSPYVCDELKAALNQRYVERIFKTVRAMLEAGDPDYYIIPAVRAISHIDRLRTMEDKRAVEKATREAMIFLPRLDNFVRLLDRSGIYANTLYFLNAALKTELLGGLAAQVGPLKPRQGSTYTTPETIMHERYCRAEKMCGTPIIKP